MRRLALPTALLALLVACGNGTAIQQGDEASDVQAQSNLRNAVTAAKTLYTENDSYVGVTPNTLAQVEPSLQFVDDEPSTGPDVISVRVLTATELRAAAYSPSGRCFGLRDLTDPAGASSTMFAVREVGDEPNACRAFSIPEGDYRLDGWAGTP